MPWLILAMSWSCFLATLACLSVESCDGDELAMNTYMQDIYREWKQCNLTNARPGSPLAVVLWLLSLSGQSHPNRISRK